VSAGGSPYSPPVMIVRLVLPSSSATTIQAAALPSSLLQMPMLPASSSPPVLHVHSSFPPLISSLYQSKTSSGASSVSYMPYLTVSNAVGSTSEPMPGTSASDPDHSPELTSLAPG